MPNSGVLNSNGADCYSTFVFILRMTSQKVDLEWRSIFYNNKKTKMMSSSLILTTVNQNNSLGSIFLAFQVSWRSNILRIINICNPKIVSITSGKWSFTPSPPPPHPHPHPKKIKWHQGKKEFPAYLQRSHKKKLNAPKHLYLLCQMHYKLCKLRLIYWDIQQSKQIKRTSWSLYYVCCNNRTLSVRLQELFIFNNI